MAKLEDEPEKSWDEFLDSMGNSEEETVAVLEKLIGSSGIVQAEERDPEIVDIVELLSACIDSSLEASERIRVIYRSNNLFPRARESRIGGDTVTLCDLEAQRAMMEGIARAFPLVRVIGQEGELDDIAFEGEGAKATAERIRRELSGEDVFDPIFNSQYTPSTNLLQAFEDEFPDELKNIPAKDITVWIDPLDGTEAMMEGLPDIACTLIGMSVKGKPIGGVAVMPFQKRMIWGIVGVGVGGDVDPKDPETSFKPIYVGGVSSIAERAITDAVDDFNLPRTRVIRHMDIGNMMTQILEGQMTQSILMARSTKFTTCGAEAILTAANAKLTDLDGNDIEYNPDEETTNGPIAISLREKEHIQTVKIGKFLSNVV
eukprot:CAMPEP_0167758354 /NCGR_PEP_ID=MMETSP0110_2-20121227/10422_1 /TAXON_ID=629695 /ORGANISM="Gymnochlora sp., Strain CCMP2014" /LENGTH=373 /DNA_ID=CAMNT_0007644621 /DNA_START=315 /DNA_END=1436 /DNA_ORIENTATION=+